MTMVVATTKRVATKKRKREEEKPWSNLPSDIMENILRVSFYLDHIHVRAVCNGWRSLEKVPPPAKQLPWLLTFPYHSLWSSCKLFDPVYKKTFDVRIDDKRLQGKQFHDLHVHTCKHGWLLLSQLKEDRNSLFLFSPFFNGRRIIDLPPLDSSSSFQIATFSSTPTDLDCVFFTLHAPPEDDTSTVCISTYSLKDSMWITRRFESDAMIGGFCSVAYLDGTFYCLTRIGTFGTYNTAQQTWRVFDKRELGVLQWRLNVKAFLVASEDDGEILLIDMIDASLTSSTHEIYKLDRVNMTWSSVRSLRDRILFLGGCNASLPATVARKKLETKLMNTIFYSCGSLLKKVSFSDSTIDKQRSYSCFRYYGPLAKDTCNKIWIENPQ